MLEIGSIVDGKYKILNVVGKGGMSVVYLAMNERANKQWAIKEVRKDGLQNFEVVKQNLIVETELLKRFNHPHLPSIIDVIDTDGTFLIVMDYIEGIPLSKALEETGAQSQEDVIEWAKQLCDVLGYLHSRKPPIIYRDMKPSNVMLKPDGNVMLIDFGTAREFKSNSVADTTCLGTQGYAAPEQFGGQGQTDARTDIYCLGATMYHLVTGHNPSTPPYEMYPIRQWNPMLSSGLEEIILKCTQRNPNDRYQSCAELLYALDHYTDLDIENRKLQSFKWKVFLTSIIMSLVMLLGTAGFAVAYTAEQASTYDSYITKAGNVMSDEEAFSYYKKAIQLEPDEMEAYVDLCDLYMSDAIFTESEYSNINSLLMDYEEKIKSKDPAAFAQELAYPIANNLYFNYKKNADDRDYSDEGKTKATRWFKKVAVNLPNTPQADRANLLVQITEMSSKVPKNNAEAGYGRDGDSVVSASEYWELLEQLSDTQLMDSQNANIELGTYLFIAQELNHRAYWFSQYIPSEDYQTLASKVNSSIESCYSGLDAGGKKRCEDLYNSCKQTMESVQEVAAQYGKNMVGDN